MKDKLSVYMYIFRSVVCVANAKYGDRSDRDTSCFHSFHWRMGPMKNDNTIRPVTHIFIECNFNWDVTAVDRPEKSQRDAEFHFLCNSNPARGVVFSNSFRSKVKRIEVRIDVCETKKAAQ